MITTTIERDGIEIEVEVETEWQNEESDVGISAGLIVYSPATGPDGKKYELTEDEQSRISEDHSDDGGGYDD